MGINGNGMLVAFLFLIIACAAVFPALNSVEADDATILSASKDSFIRKRGYDANEGANPILQVKYAVRPLVAFDQSAIASILEGKTLLSAKLSLYIVKNGNNWGENGQTSVHMLLENWEEGNGWNVGNNIPGSGLGVTWRCAIDNDINNDETNCETRWRGGKFAPETDSVLTMNGLIDQRIEFDVTDDVNEFLSGTPNYGWLIKKSDERQPGRVDFASSESANGPELILAYASQDTIPNEPSNDVPDTSPPAIQITSPADGTVVNGPLQISATATDNVEVTSVHFFYDDTFIGTDTEEPYDALWNAGIANGVYTITAKAVDASGNTATSPAISITVDYPMPAPEPTPTPTPDTYQLSVSNFESYNGFLVYESSALGSYNVSVNHGTGIFYVESNYGTISVTLSHTTSGGTTLQSFLLSNGEYRGINVSSGDYVLVSMTSNSNPVQFAFVFDPAL